MICLICTLSSTSRRWVLCPVFFVGSYDGREEEMSVTYRAAGSGRGARVSALCPDQRSLGGKYYALHGAELVRRVLPGPGHTRPLHCGN